jgi:branched-chain amino acid transport system permease protein
MDCQFLGYSCTYFLNLILNGILIGCIYGLMAMGLTLIFSILGIVSFAHGEYYMIGGYVVYYLLESFSDINAVLAVLLAGLTTFLVGTIFERLFLQPMARGEIERPGEYAILVTFGLAFFLQFLMVGIVGPFPVKAARFFDLPEIDWGWLMSRATTLELFGIPLAGGRLIAAGVAIIMLGAMVYFMGRTWIGKALQAVSQDRQAAAVVGINPQSMNTLAFGLGTMLAGMSGAVLVTVFSWVPWVGVPASSKSFVIIVLGGMGSMPGAVLGGIIIGLVESLGTGFFPDPTRALAYKDAFGLLIFALVLLIRPTGLFGREL